MKLKSLLLFAALLMGILPVQAAGLDESMHASGKINVVFGVVLLIFAVIVVYLFLLDRKVKRIERDLNEK